MDDEQAYRGTTFEAETPVGRVEIRVGGEDERIDRLLEFCSAESWAFLTAWNPEGTFTNETENRRRQEELESEFDERDCRTFPGEAVPDPAEWAPEQALLVVGLSRDEVLQVGREYGQDAVVWGRRGEPAGLIDCESGEDVPDAGDAEPGPDAGSNEADEVLEELGGTVRESVERYSSEPPSSMQNAVDWDLVLRSMDDDYPDPDLD